MGTVPGRVWLGLHPPAIIYQTLGGGPGLRNSPRPPPRAAGMQGGVSDWRLGRWNFAFATAAAGASGFSQKTAGAGRGRRAGGRGSRGGGGTS